MKTSASTSSSSITNANPLQIQAPDSPPGGPGAFYRYQPKGVNRINIVKVIGIILIVTGVLGLIYGGFTYTSDTHDADLGPIEFSITEQDRVNVPVWAGVGSIAIGVGLLLFGRRRT